MKQSSWEFIAYVREPGVLVIAKKNIQEEYPEDWRDRNSDLEHLKKVEERRDWLDLTKPIRQKTENELRYKCIDWLMEYFLMYNVRAHLRERPNHRSPR